MTSMMTAISAVASGPSYFSQDEASLPPRQPGGELVNWFASETHSFLGTNSMRAAIVVPMPDDNSKGPESAHVNDHQSHPGGFTTSATAIIPISGLPVPTRVTLSLVPLHLGTGQRPPSLNLSSPPTQVRGSEFIPFPPPQPSEPSHIPKDYAMAGSDTTNDPCYWEYTTTLGGFPLVIPPGNSIPRPDGRYDHRSPRHNDTTQEPMSDGTTAVVTAPPGVAVYPPPFNLTPGVYYQNEGNGQSTSQAGQTYQDTSTSLTTVDPVRGMGVDQHSNRHKCTMCAASYVWPSGLNRHVKDKHKAWMTCPHCNAEFSLGRMYKFTEHLETCPGA